MNITRARAQWTIPVLLIVAALLPGCITTGALHRESRQSQTPNIPGAVLRVTTANGDISVREGDQDVVLIRADLKAMTPERLSAAAVTAERLDDGTLAVGVAWPDGERKVSEGCDFQIVLPAAAGVELRTTNGSIEAVGMAGQAVLTSSNGSIDVVRHQGGVAAETSNGVIRIDGAAGPVLARTSNGSVTVGAAAAGVDVETSNGAVEVDLADDSPGPVRIRTDNGRVELRLGPAFRGELALKTRGGKLDVGGLRGAEVLSMESGAARLQVGEGGVASSVQTSNGRIRISGGER